MYSVVWFACKSKGTGVASESGNDSFFRRGFFCVERRVASCLLLNTCQRTKQHHNITDQIMFRLTCFLSCCFRLCRCGRTSKDFLRDDRRLQCSTSVQRKENRRQELKDRYADSYGLIEASSLLLLSKLRFGNRLHL